MKFETKLLVCLDKMVNPEIEVVMPEKEEYPVSENYFIVTGEWTQCCLR